MAGITVPTLSNLITVISKIAPLLGSILIGPFSTIALSLLTNLFGVDPLKTDQLKELLEKIKHDPDAAFKIKKLEFDHQEALKQLQNQAYATQIDDRKSARLRHISIQDHMPNFLAISFFLYYALVQLYYGYYHITANCRINDNLQTILMQIIKFYFGA